MDAFYKYNSKSSIYHKNKHFKFCAVIFQLPGKQVASAENPCHTDEAQRKCHGKEKETSDQSYQQPSEEEKIRPVKCVKLQTTWLKILKCVAVPG